jgi:hypothetical protein
VWEGIRSGCVTDFPSPLLEIYEYVTFSFSSILLPIWAFMACYRVKFYILLPSMAGSFY